MTTENKRTVPGAAGGAPAVDTTTRARNRTVIMSSEMTGQVRARLGGEFQPVTPERSGGFVAAESEAEDGWASPVRDAASLDVAADDVGAPSMSFVEDQPMMVDDTENADASALEWGEASPVRTAPVAPATEYAPQVEDDDSDYVDLEKDEVAQHAEAPAMIDESEAPSQPVTPVRVLRRPSEWAAPAAPALATEPEPEPEAQNVEFEPMPQQEYLETILSNEAHDEEVGQQEEVEEQQQVEEQLEEAQDMAHESITWKGDTTLVGFLVTYDHDKRGSFVELRTGRLMVTSEPEASGNCLVIRHESVSPMHAIMRVGTSGTVQVLDQLSEYGTKIRRGGSDEEDMLSGEKGMLKHGDVVCFGERSYHVCLIAPPTE